MATDIYINPTTGDIDLNNGQMRLTNTIAELTQQRLDITLNVNKGTWQFNVNFGTPWLKNEYSFVQLLGKNSKGFFDATIKNLILATEGVLSMSEYSSTVNPTTRIVDINFTVLTKQGEISVSTSTDIGA